MLTQNSMVGMFFISLRLLVLVMGCLLVGFTLNSAIKTFILPRGVNVWLTRLVFQAVGTFFMLRGRRASYEQRDQIMAMFAPLTLFVLPVVLLVLVLVGYMGIFWGLEPQPLTAVFTLSGSSLLTLGYASHDGWLFKAVEFSEAMIGLILMALLIAYLPTMYAAFAKRETAVAMWETRAGSPPSVAEMIARSHRTNELHRLRDVWLGWQTWFAELEESHTSLAPLAFFRSPRPDRSWVVAAGNALDSAAFILSTVDTEYTPQAAFCIRSGFITLRHIAGFFGIPYNANPAPTDPISISREEYDALCATLEAQGVPLHADRNRTWADFAGWRVNYDSVLLALAHLTMAPYAEWVSDRSVVQSNR